jgi:hypothetical protein
LTDRCRGTSVRNSLTLDDRLVRATALTTGPLDCIRDGILRGVAHALSNRVAALSGVAGLVDFGNLPADRLSRALSSEVSQLGQLVEMLRLLPSDIRPRGEAIELKSLLPSIVALHALHADLRDVPCTIQHDRNAQPIHLSRSVFVHAVLVLIDVAKRDALRDRGSVSLTYAGDSTWVTVVAESLPGAVSPTSGGSTGAELELKCLVDAAVAELDPSLAVDVQRRGQRSGTGLRLELRLPTLLEVRRREREAKGEPTSSDAR